MTAMGSRFCGACPVNCAERAAGGDAAHETRRESGAVVDFDRGDVPLGMNLESEDHLPAGGALPLERLRVAGTRPTPQAVLCRRFGVRDVTRYARHRDVAVQLSRVWRIGRRFRRARGVVARINRYRPRSASGQVAGRHEQRSVPGGDERSASRGRKGDARDAWLARDDAHGGPRCDRPDPTCACRADLR